MKTTCIERIQNHAASIKAGEIERVRPGMPAAFTDACIPNDCVRQGDLYLIVVENVPEGYQKVAKPTSADKQLVPGNTDGAKHCLDSLQGVTLYRPQKWDEESLDGPCFILTKERKVLHPIHGHVTIPSGFTVLCCYQREWDKVQAAERRARD